MNVSQNATEIPASRPRPRSGRHVAIVLAAAGVGAALGAAGFAGVSALVAGDAPPSFAAAAARIEDPMAADPTAADLGAAIVVPEPSAARQPAREPSPGPMEELGAAVGELVEPEAEPAIEADNGFEADPALETGASGDEEAPLATFAVVGDEPGPAHGDAAAIDRAHEIWSRFIELIPADQRRMVVGFELLSADFGGAYVYPTEADPSQWVLGVGLGLGDDLDAVLVHEFGHLLTLQVREVPPGGDPGSCTTYYTGEGCALSGSTFAEFVERFWPPSMLDEIDRIQSTADESEYGEAFDRFHEKHRDAFVTDYATTNPGEDLAETFMVFVLDDRPGGPVADQSIADAKIKFLWDDPAMVALRDQIRARL